jgi:histone-arginine methyltransferase CARM1
MSSFEPPSRWADILAPPELRKQAKEAFDNFDMNALSKDNFLDVVSACGRRCIAKCPNELAVVEVEGFLMEMAAQIWADKKFQDRCPLRELLSRLRVSSEFGSRECAFMTKYFYYFGKMRSHDGMMNDIGRTETYRKAIHGNPDNFKDKIVMDVGSGSGLLAFFAIQAGAKKVYAIEAGCMHEVIRMLAEANGWGDKIVVVNKVLQDMTEADCPLNSVDTIVAETLGTFLFGERGIETMLVARDRFLKKDGAIFPTRATLSVQPFSDEKLYNGQCAIPMFWSGKDFYGIDLSCCHERAVKEQLTQVVAAMVDPDTLVSKQHDVVYDFRTLDPAGLRRIQLEYKFPFAAEAEMHGLAGWFVAEFVGANQTTTLSTAPQDTCTHWWQVRFMLPKPLSLKTGQDVTGSMELVANEQQTYTCSMEMEQKTDTGVEKRSNCDMGLMDLDGAQKTYSYKTVTHGNVSVACVDWEKTTQEARNRKKPCLQLSQKRADQKAQYDGLEYYCTNVLDRYLELKSKPLAIVAKIGNDDMLGVIGDTRRGLIRREETGEESLWMEEKDFQDYMIEFVTQRKKHLQGYQEKPEDEVRSHFKKLQFFQVKEVFDALRN